MGRLKYVDNGLTNSLAAGGRLVHCWDWPPCPPSVETAVASFDSPLPRWSLDGRALSTCAGLSGFLRPDVLSTLHRHSAL